MVLTKGFEPRRVDLIRFETLCLHHLRLIDFMNSQTKASPSSGLGKNVTTPYSPRHHLPPRQDVLGHPLAKCSTQKAPLSGLRHHTTAALRSTRSGKVRGLLGTAIRIFLGSNHYVNCPSVGKDIRIQIIMQNSYWIVLHFISYHYILEYVILFYISYSCILNHIIPKRLRLIFLYMI